MSSYSCSRVFFIAAQRHVLPTPTTLYTSTRFWASLSLSHFSFSFLLFFSARTLFGLGECVALNFVRLVRSMGEKRRKEEDRKNAADLRNIRALTTSAQERRRRVFFDNFSSENAPREKRVLLCAYCLFLKEKRSVFNPPFIAEKDARYLSLSVSSSSPYFRVQRLQSALLKYS